MIVGPIFTPIGLAMPRKYSTWAPSSARVRSPIQGKCVVRLYHCAALRHLAGLRLLVIQVQPFVAGEELDAVQLVRSARPVTVSRKRIPLPTASTIAR